MAWLFLIVGGFFESLFSFSLGKISETTGRESVFWFLGFVFFVALSMWFLYKAIDTGLGIGLSYAVWASIGIVGSVVLGVIFLHEPISFWKVFFLTTLLISVVGLKLVTSN